MPAGRLLDFTEEAPMKLRVVVALSGGVDSAAAALLLTEEGHDVTAVTMRTWADGDGSHSFGCHGPADEEEARRVAQALGIPFHTIDVTHEFESEVIDYFRHEYLSGRTPNPCIRCNRRIKFGALVDKVRDHGIEFDCFATGHYARVHYDVVRRRYVLRKASDNSKDQSYFLFSLSQGQLARALFPLGAHTKEEARALVSRLGLGLENRTESQDFAASHYAPVFAAAAPGPVVNTRGDVLGRHHGIAFYTVGQRKGLGIATGQPLYVARIDRDTNTITVGTREDVYCDELVASDLNWVALDGLHRPLQVRAKIRHSHGEAHAVAAPLDEDRIGVRFSEPQMAIAPGQAVVLYQGEQVLAGGVIESSTSHPQ